MAFSYLNYWCQATALAETCVEQVDVRLVNYFILSRNMKGIINQLVYELNKTYLDIYIYLFIYLYCNSISQNFWGIGWGIKKAGLEQQIQNIDAFQNKLRVCIAKQQAAASNVRISIEETSQLQHDALVVQIENPNINNQQKSGSRHPW